MHVDLDGYIFFYFNVYIAIITGQIYMNIKNSYSDDKGWGTRMARQRMRYMYGILVKIN